MPWVRLDAIGVAAQLRRELIGFRDCGRKALQGRVEARIELCRAAKLALREREAVARRAAITGQQIARGMRGLAELLGRARHGERRFELGIFVRAKPCRSDLVDLVREQRGATLAFAW